MHKHTKKFPDGHLHRWPFFSFWSSAAALRESERRYKLLFENMSSGFALHEIICDSAGKPQDYRFLEVNPAFERLTGLKAADLIGKTVREVLPQTEEHWIQQYGEVALNGKPASFENYSGTLGRHYEVIAYSPAPRQFATIFLDITDRREVEGLLRNSQAQFANALTIAHLGPWEYDALRDEFTFNDNFYAMFRTTAQAVGGYTMSSAEYARRFIHPEDVSIVRDENLLAAQTSDPGFNRQLEHRIIYADGEIGYISVRYFIVKDAQGRTVRTYGVNQDITVRKQAEKTLGMAKEYLNAVINAIADPVFVKDAQHRFVLVNDAFCSFAGFSREQSVGKNDYDFFPKEQVEIFWRYDEELLRTGKENVNEEQITDTQGQTHIIVTKKSLYTDPSGNRFIVGIIRDVSQMKKIERELFETQRRLKTLIDNLSGMVYRCRNDKDWTMDFISEACLPICGYPSEEFLSGRVNFGKIIHPQDRETVWNSVQDAVAKHQPYTLLYRIIAANQQEKWIWEQGRGVFDEKGELLALEGFITDYTEHKKAQDDLRTAYISLKEAQAQLVQSAKMAAMGQLVAGVSHELNQPLTGIKGFAQTAYAELGALSGVPEVLRDDLKKIIMQSDRMVSIIENLRMFSRKSDSRMEKLDINAPLRASVQLLDQQFKVHSIGLSVNLGEGLPAVAGDDNQLQQVFLNFLTNARDAIETAQRRDGRVTISSGLAGDREHIEVVISDNGCGIAADEIEHIFNPFFTTKSPNRGMGLGLSIAYSIINNHCGHIEVSSEEGKGTAFKVVLPVAS